MLARKRIVRAGFGKGIVRGGSGNKGMKLWELVMETKWVFNAVSSLNKLWIQKYYHNERRFNSVYSTNTLPKKVKDSAYVINLDEYADIGTH